MLTISVFDDPKHLMYGIHVFETSEKEAVGKLDTILN